jgi:hypothetical protein
MIKKLSKMEALLTSKVSFLEYRSIMSEMTSKSLPKSQTYLKLQPACVNQKLESYKSVGSLKTLGSTAVTGSKGRSK